MWQGMKQRRDADRVVGEQNKLADALNMGNREFILRSWSYFSRYLRETDVDPIVKGQAVRSMRPLTLQVLVDIRKKNAAVFDLSGMD